MLRSVEAQSEARKHETTLVVVVGRYGDGVAEVTGCPMRGQLQMDRPCMYDWLEDGMSIGCFILWAHENKVVLEIVKDGSFCARACLGRLVLGAVARHASSFV
jgi:hypothetical protein